MDIFEYEYQRKSQNNAPLAAKVRPKKLGDFVGQEKILGKNTTLYKAIINDALSSIILFGPPGTGKTTLAKVIANSTQSSFVELNATTSGVKDIKDIVQKAKDLLALKGTKTLVFIDEIHRFNKSQQDTLLPYVEEGTITIVGATTENPFFEVNKALLSRCIVFTLEPLSKEEIVQILERAAKLVGATATPEALEHIAHLCGGDARFALNALEIGINSSPDKTAPIDLAHIKASISQPITYDKAGEGHYNTISAFIKSIRGSDPDAAVYYLGRMLTAGEDPKFIARRMIISASEDIGNADPNALTIATSGAHAVQYVGMPECRIVLSQVATYLATAPKSNAAYLAINQATQDATMAVTIPPHLKNYNMYEDSEDYKYPHNYPTGYVQQQYMPQELEGVTYYHPKDIGYEANIIAHMNKIKSEDN